MYKHPEYYSHLRKEASVALPLAGAVIGGLIGGGSGYVLSDDDDKKKRNRKILASALIGALAGGSLGYVGRGMTKGQGLSEKAVPEAEAEGFTEAPSDDIKKSGPIKPEKPDHSLPYDEDGKPMIVEKVGYPGVFFNYWTGKYQDSQGYEVTYEGKPVLSPEDRRKFTHHQEGLIEQDIKPIWEGIKAGVPEALRRGRSLLRALVKINWYPPAKATDVYDYITKQGLHRNRGQIGPSSSDERQKAMESKLQGLK